MAQLRFDGIGAGLGKRSESGDRNDPANYMVMCSCGVELGPLVRFRAVQDIGAMSGDLVTRVSSGENVQRMIRCGRCGSGIFVRGTSITSVLDPAAMRELDAKIQAARAAGAQADGGRKG